MRLIIYTITVFLFFGCTKGGGNIYVTGRVYNPVTGEGIPDIEVRLSRPKIGGTIGDGAGNKIVKRVKTDENGHYQVSHLGGALNTYRIQFAPGTGKYYGLGTAPNNNDVPVGNIAFIVDKGKNMEVDFEMVPYAGIRNHIENINCQGPNDNFKLYYLGSEIEPKDEAVLAIEGDGCFDYIREKYVSIPMGERYYKWEVTKNGVTNTYYDTLDLDAGEEYTFEILY